MPPFCTNNCVLVYLQPDGVWEGGRQPAHRGLYHPLPGSGRPRGQDVGYIPGTIIQGKTRGVLFAKGKEIGERQKGIKHYRSIKKRVSNSFKAELGRLDMEKGKELPLTK